MMERYSWLNDSGARDSFLEHIVLILVLGVDPSTWAVIRRTTTWSIRGLPVKSYLSRLPTISGDSFNSSLLKTSPC
jgi:hypothetical protein